MLAGGGFTYKQVQITGTNTSVDIGKNTHNLPFKPVVYDIVPVRTSATGNVNPNTTFWWDKTAADNLDGGNSVRVSCGAAPGAGNHYTIGVLLGPATPGSTVFE